MTPEDFAATVEATIATARAALTTYYDQYDDESLSDAAYGVPRALRGKLAEQLGDIICDVARMRSALGTGQPDLIWPAAKRVWLLNLTAALDPAKLSNVVLDLLLEPKPRCSPWSTMIATFPSRCRG
jgi:hypothetical protein